MKKKGISIVALVAVITMSTLSLTGCGTQVKATDVQISEENLDEETIIVTESADTENTSESTSENNYDEITSTEIIRETEGTEVNTETEVQAFTGAENEDIVLYAEKGPANYVELDYETFEPFDVTFTAREEIMLVGGDGHEVGYIKAGGNVTVTGCLADYDWARFENPIEGTEYEYLYLMKSSIPNPDTVYPTVEEIVTLIEENLFRRAFDAPVVLDAPTDDMEVFEFVLDKEYDSQPKFESAVSRGCSDDYLGGVLDYMSYYIECEEEANIFRCKLYYKDKYVDPNPYY